MDPENFWVLGGAEGGMILTRPLYYPNHEGFGFAFCSFQFCGHRGLDPMLAESLHFGQDFHTLPFIVDKSLKD